MPSQFEIAIRHEVSVNRLASQIVAAHINPAFININELVRRLMLDYDSSMSTREYEALRKRTEKQLRKALETMWGDLTKDLKTFADYEAEYHAKALSAASGQAFATVTAAVVSESVNKNLMTLVSGDTVKTGFWPEWVAGNADSTIKLVDAEIRAGRAAKLGNAEIVKRITGLKKNNYEDGLLNKFPKNWAKTLVNTGASHYANMARKAVDDANADVIEGLVFSNVMDNRTSRTCFTADTPVSSFGRIINIFRSKYSGETVTIRTASGKKLVGTPNHPILTAAGFLPMGELDPSKHVVYSPLLDSVSVCGNNDISMETTIGELFDSFCKPSVSSISSERSSANDFYGDGYRGDGEVDIVFPNSELRYNVKTILDKQISDNFFSFVSDWLPLKGFCSFLYCLLCWRPIIETSQVTACQPEVLVKKAFGSSSFKKYFRWAKSCFKHFNSFFPVGNNHRVSNTSWEMFHDSMSLKNGCDSGGAAIILGCDFASGKAIPVLVDNIISVERKFAEHYVYTLETDNGSYIAGGLIVKNCLHYGQLARDGKVYAVDDPALPRPPLHPNCRSILIRKLKGVDPFEGKQAAVAGRKGEEAQSEFEARQARTNKKVKYRGRKDSGIFDAKQIDADISPQQFYSQQPDWYLESVFGKTGAKLFKAGKMPIEKFADTYGRPLTIKQMRELDEYDVYFEKAGL